MTSKSNKYKVLLERIEAYLKFLNSPDIFQIESNLTKLTEFRIFSNIDTRLPAGNPNNPTFILTFKQIFQNLELV